MSLHVSGFFLFFETNFPLHSLSTLRHLYYVDLLPLSPHLLYLTNHFTMNKDET
jgi:hypothetical protein